MFPLHGTIKACRIGVTAAPAFTITSAPKFTLKESAQRSIRLPSGRIITVEQATAEEFQHYVQHIYRQFRRIASPYLKAAGDVKNKRTQVYKTLPSSELLRLPVNDMESRWYILLELREAIGGPGSRYGSIRLFVEESREQQSGAA